MKRVTPTRKHNEWRNKAHRGRHLHTVPNEWLVRGELFRETEGFMVAILDQVINYLKPIIKEANIHDDRCKICESKPETITYIISGYSALTKTTISKGIIKYQRLFVKV